LCRDKGEFGTGTIPLVFFAKPPVMVPGGTGSIDTLSVAHHTDAVRDGISTATFKSFEQGATKMQSESVDWIWIDERCPEDVYSELLARTSATDGILFMSYTPLKGGGELTYRFLNEYSADRSDTRIEAHQARHISAERRAQLEENYLPHEREARIHGIPQFGTSNHGRVGSSASISATGTRLLPRCAHGFMTPRNFSWSTVFARVARRRSITSSALPVCATAFAFR
jgi:phage terminase large subunit-like protein